MNAGPPDGAAGSWMATIRGFLFDIGDTLLPAGTLQRETLVTVIERLDSIGWPAVGRPFGATYLRFDADPVFDALEDLNHLYSDARIVSATFAAIGVQATDAEVQQFLMEYRSTLRSRILPDRAWLAAFDFLQRCGFRLGIVSNGTTVEQHDQIERLGLTSYFDPILISQEVGIRKPSPEILLIGARHWGLAPPEIVVVGDRPDWEAAAAQHAGMKSILTVQYVDRRDRVTPQSTPDAVIDGPGDLLTLVEAGHAGI
jgi:HAD superfamily hydrolase (TIGR01549 family)